MILVDVNLLVDATMTSARDHRAAHFLAAGSLGGDRPGRIALSVPARLRPRGRQPRVWERPLPVSAALTIVRSWLSRPCAWIPEPGPRHVDILDGLLAAQPAVRW